MRTMEDKINELTLRELEVLKFVANGESNNSIAEKMNITSHTVKAHLTQIFKKLGVKNRTSAAIIAKDNKITLLQDSILP